MKSLKLFSLFVVALAVLVPAAYALTHSNANLNGLYLFQMTGTTNSYGYDTCSGNSCVWTDVTGDCPVGQSCQSSAFTKFVYGTVVFDGNGHVTSATFTEYHPVGGPGPHIDGGTAAGHYSIAAGGNGTITLTPIGGGTPEVMSVYLGQVDPTTGIAGSAIIHTEPTDGDAGSTEAGFAFHQ